MAGGVENYTLNYTSSGYNTVTDPHGLTTNYYITNASGSPVVGTSVLMQGGNATLQENNYTYDDAGNVTSDTHFGILTTYTYDLTRNLETSRTEAVGTPQQRTISTQYDPNLPVPVLITESGRTTAYTYDATGNVLTKTITDTTTNSSRVWTYTYNSMGQKLTSTNPAGEKTTNSYDSNGRLLTITDALGYATTFGGYTALGQPTTITTPNGAVTTYTYDDAGRVLTTAQTVATDVYQTSDTKKNTIKWPQWVIDLINAWFKLIGSSSPFDSAGGLSATVSQPFLNAASTRTETTTYAYDPIGQLTQVKMPDGATLTYTYDAAHRLIGATDSLGNSISYTLNGAGDITQTNSQDPTGQIKLQTQQVFDTLGRVQQDLGNNGQSTTYTYDNLNNLTGTTDALSRRNNSTYDALNHKVSDLDALGGTTQYSYNALDQLLTITDSRNNTTSYTPNAFGENISQTSPDTGTATRIYTNGRLMSETDSAGIIHSYSYDNAGRVLQRTDGTGTGQLINNYGYDVGTYGKGTLTSLKDANSETHYTRDSTGHVVDKVTAINSGVPLRIEYKYLAGDKISDIMMPSGHHITYVYTAGKITSMSSDGTTLLSNIKYAPTGIASWTWGTGTDTNTLRYDTDGRMTGVSSTGVLGRNYSYDQGNRILSIADTLASIGIQSYSHDNLDRLTLQTLTGQTLAYSYDANSNRTRKTVTPQGGTALTSTYALQSSTNRIDTTAVGTGTALTSTYLPTGQLVTDGIRTYSYDAAGRSSTVRYNSMLMLNTYNGLGQRIKKNVNNIATYFAYDESGHLMGEYDQNRNTIREYLWLGDRIVGMYSSQVAKTVLRVHTDQLGTPRAVTQGNGSRRKVLWRYEGDAFGDVLPTNPTTTKLTMPIRMAGQYYDAEVGTSYNYFRDYDASKGRYDQSDPIGLNGGLNTYGYVVSNPLSFSDPSGQYRCVLTFSNGSGSMSCNPDNPAHLPFSIPVASGNNGGGTHCKNNPECEATPNRGPIPRGDWHWNLNSPGDNNSKPNGHRLFPNSSTNTFGRSGILSHSCINAFGPSLGPTFCSEGCVTGSAGDMHNLNNHLGSESNNSLHVTGE
jgi:RHS repeat-associated protein